MTDCYCGDGESFRVKEMNIAKKDCICAGVSFFMIIKLCFQLKFELDTSLL